MNHVQVRRRGFTVAYLVAMGSLAAMSHTTTSGAQSAPTITVAGGRLEGVFMEKGGAVFKGIPYAQPPVGELRWREPVPTNSWSGVRDATNFGAPCMQTTRAGGANAGGTASEDCLFLNVWTPDWPRRVRRPVMVEIHGGGHYGGAGSLEEYDGEVLARRGVVLVTINYRLGVFGLFAHPELTRESPHHASGNQGLLDQIASLQWVHDNIKEFGGEPANVTIVGQSSGSVDVSALMTSPLSRGLFRHVIAESGTVTTTFVGGESMTLAAANFHARLDDEARAGALARVLGVPDSLDRLRRIPAANLVAAASQLAPRLGIIVDGYALPLLPSKVFAAGKQHRVDLMAGNSAREHVPGTTPPADLRKAIEDGYGPLAARAAVLYEQAGPDPVYGTPSEQWAADSTFRCSSVAQLAWHASAGNSAYEYEFQRAAPGLEASGAEHTAETPYVFGTLRHGLAHTSHGFARVVFNAIDEQLADAMQRYWTNFAKRGDPNDSALPNWPKFNSTARAYLKFTDNGPVAAEGLRRPFCDVYMENLSRHHAQ